MQKRHFVALDGLRGVAALVVMIFHIPHWSAGGPFTPRGGYLAVDFFFMLSGFVIDYAYLERMRTGMTFGGFVRIRVIRLYPLIVTGATIGLAVVVLGRLFLNAGRFKLAAAFPFAILGLPIPGLIDTNHFVLNTPAWSLFFELVANLAFAVILFRLSTKQLIAVTAVLATGLAMTGIHFGTIGFGHDEHWYWRGSMRVGFPFAMGMLLNRVASRKEMVSIPFLVAAALLVATFFSVPTGDQPWPVELACVLIIYPLLILSAQAARPSAFWSAAAKMGGFVSYPLYILHWPVMDFIAIGFVIAGIAWSSPVVVVAVLLIAYGAGVVDARVRGRLTHQLVK